MPTPPITRPVRMVTEFAAAEIVDADFLLFDLYRSCARSGQKLVSGKTFRGCRIEGPGILLVSRGVRFQDVNFGDSRGEAGNLVLRGVGTKAIGAIPCRDCVFIGCEFLDVGFTGTPAFLDELLAIPNAGESRP